MPLNPRRRIVYYMDAKTLERFLAKYPLERRNEIAKQAFLDFMDMQEVKNLEVENCGAPLAHRWKFHSELAKSGTLVLIYVCKNCMAVCRAVYELDELTGLAVLNPFREKRK